MQIFRYCISNSELVFDGVSLSTFGIENLLSNTGLTWGELAPGLLIFLFLGMGVLSRWSRSKRKRKYDHKYEQRDTRTKLSLPLIINTPVTQEFSVRTFDISMSGAFLPYEDLKTSMSFTSLIGKRSGIKIGDLIDIKILTGRFSRLHCQARVIRYNFLENSGIPMGIGIEFMNLSQRKKKVLKHLIESRSPRQKAS